MSSTLYFFLQKKQFMVQALALLSGGLDSTLAIKIILDEGIKIIALHFIMPFCRCDRCATHLVAWKFGIQLKQISLSRQFLEMLPKPKYGYGSQINPCIDCRIMMFSHARVYMEQIGASFIVTGEVVGQRPMSQHRQALKLIEKESGLEGLVLRPLSAHLLEPTLPEKTGLVNRNKLLAICGRSRRKQIELAENHHIKDYACPAGGCLLTDPSFSPRVRDLLRYGKLDINEVLLLKYGRHFRLDHRTKLVVGRNEKENKVILSLRRAQDVVIDMSRCPGPVGLLRDLDGKLPSLSLVQLACGITARYATMSEQLTQTLIQTQNGITYPVKITSLPDSQVRTYLIGSLS